MPGRPPRPCTLAVLAGLIGLAGLVCAHGETAPSVGGGLTQIGPRVIDRNRIDQSPSTVTPPPAKVTPDTARGKASAPPGIENQSLTLRDITIEGATAIPAARLRALWAGRQGTSIRVHDVYAISDAVAQAYADAGYALYSVSVPRQDFASGHIRIHVTEGYVASVSITGNTKGADLSVLKAQAARIVADRPLHQATLERNILLMNEIAGLTVGSQFKPVPGKPGAVQLQLSIARKTFEYGLDFDNEGNALLSRTQLAANVAINSLFREGDRTQLVVGVPATLERYQYYGVSHVEPIGTQGAKITVNLGELVTNGVNHTDAGNALLGDITGSFPLIRSVRESLTATASFDLLNSNDALLGQTLTDERTRVLRAGLSWAKQDVLVGGLSGVSAISFSLSEGLDALGARRGNLAFGGPDFTKLNARIARSQDLPWNLVLRGKVAAQGAFSHLPATEQFIYGGPDFGQAFDTAAALGDSALAAGLEVAYRLPQAWFPSFLSGNEVFVFSDYATLWSRNTAYQLPEQTGATAGVGVRTKLLDKLGVELAIADPVKRPEAAVSDNGIRFVAQLSGKF